LNERGNISTRTLDLIETAEAGIQLKGNNPNPWADWTEINFTIDYEDNALINFYDSSGKLLTQRNIQTRPGLNKLRIQKDELQSAGLIIYEIISTREKHQGKMILLK
jgi:hypothetical protein